MPVEYSMVENGRVALITITDSWTVEDLVQFTEHEMSVFENTLTTVHSFADMTACKLLPERVLRLRNLPTLSHQRAGYKVMVGVPAPLQQIGRVLGHLTDYHKIVFVNALNGLSNAPV